MILAMKQQCGMLQRFVVEQEKIPVKYPDLLDRKEWMIYMGQIKQKSRLAVALLDKLDESLTDDSELAFHVVEARVQAVETHRLANSLYLTGVFRRVTSISAKGERVRAQYDILSELIKHVFMLLGKADLIARISRAM
jgi:ribosomal protein S17E